MATRTATTATKAQTRATAREMAKERNITSKKAPGLLWSVVVTHVKTNRFGGNSYSSVRFYLATKAEAVAFNKELKPVMAKDKGRKFSKVTKLSK